MKIPLNWLKEHVEITLPPTELAERLTMAGIEVKGVQVIGDYWEQIVTGQILEITPHPNADRLRLVTVDLGAEKSTVVCGAPNLSRGDKIVFAQVGAQLIDGHSGELVRLKSAKIRGVVSSGMVCSEKELGISDSHEGILVLSPEAPLGVPLADYLGDVILDLDVTPNRPDCLSVMGIAREIAALTGQQLPTPEVDYAQSPESIAGQVSVEIIAPELCPRYCASLITGVTVGESPQWLQQRLLKYGMRPINNIVDVTNYVMIEHGQPLHAFDYHQIQGKQIIVRRAHPGETIATLDGVDRNLSDDMLVIADAKRAVAVAGVMGGAESEVTGGTTAILLEAANFNPASIYHTGTKLQLPSEARARFERGIRPELAQPALKRATQLIVELGEGEAAKGIIDAYPGRADHQPIRLATDKVKKILDIELSPDQIVAALAKLGFVCEAEAAAVRATAPYWRSDIRQDVDLIEEVARIIGYDQIPTTLLAQSVPQQDPDPLITLKRRVKQSLVGYGFCEVITYSLTSLALLSKLLPESGSPDPFPLRIANPMTLEQEYLRPNLRANLLATLASNRRHETGSIRIFELGKVYLPRADDLPEEPEMLCGVLSGARTEESWSGSDGQSDFYDAKGVLEGLFNQLGSNANFETSQDVSLHPQKQAKIVINGEQVGVVGELHPRVLATFDIANTVLFEVSLSQLLPATLDHRMFQSIARFPVVERDIALILDTNLASQQVRDIIQGFPLVAKVTIFDVYSGKQVPPGKKSLAYRITFQSPDHTLTDDEVDRVQNKILDKLVKELGATLRSQ